jgi:hypothetical protein
MSDAQPQTDFERRMVEKYGGGDQAKAARIVAKIRKERGAPAPAGPTTGERVAGFLLSPMAPGVGEEIAKHLPSGAAVKDAAVDFAKDEAGRIATTALYPPSLLLGPWAQAPGSRVIRESVFGDKPVDEAVAAGLGDATVETVVGAATAGAGKVLGRGASILRGTRGVEKLAAEVGNAARAARPVPGQPSTRSFFEKSLELAKASGDDIFSPAEMLGDPAIALAEQTALQMPKTMRAAQAMRTSRLKGTARFLDGLTDRMAADPTKIGNSKTAEALASTVEQHIQSLKSARSEAARPLYEKAETLLGSKKVAPIDEVTSFISTELERAVGPFQRSAAPLKQTLEVLQADARGGLANIKTVRSLAEKWGQQAEGTGELLADLPISQRKYVAGRLSELLNRSIDAAAQSGQKTDAGIQALRQAQASWAAHSQAINDLPQEALGKILKVGGGEAGDTLVDRMLTMSPDQLAGVAKVVRKTNPDVAKQIGADMMESLLVRGGKPARGSSIASAIGASEIKPQTSLSTLAKHESKLMAFYEGDAEAQRTLRRVMETLQRKAQGPGLRGSQSVPLMAQLLEDGAENAATAVAGPQAGGVMHVLRKLLGSDKAIAQAVTDPDKLRLLDQALQLQLGMAQGNRVSDVALASLLRSAGHLGVETKNALLSQDSLPREPRPYFAGGKQ